MKKTRVQKPYVKPEIRTLDPSEAAEAVAKPKEEVVENPEQLPPPPPPVRPERARVRYAKVTVFLSLTLHLSHEEFCVKAGKCFCEMTAAGRSGKTWHLIAGVPQIVPWIWTTHPLIQAQLRAGRAVVKAQ